MKFIASRSRRDVLRAALALLVAGRATTSAAQATAAAASAAPTASTPGLLLAERYRRGMDLRDWWVSEKYDGVRAYWDGQRLWSRGGTPILAPAWFTQGWPATALDGELWAGRGRFEQAQSAAARAQPDDAQWNGLRYMVFDLPAHGGSFDERLAVLNGLAAAIDRPWVQATPQRKVPDDAALQALLRQVVQGGGEGLMLHRGSSLYRSGRSDDLLKLKPHDDAEARVVAHQPGRGRLAGLMGALLVETPSGQRFALGSGFTDDQRRNPPPVGSWVTYRYRGQHDSGLPRFATFLRVRTDLPGSAR